MHMSHNTLVVPKPLFYHYSQTSRMVCGSSGKRESWLKSREDKKMSTLLLVYNERLCLGLHISMLKSIGIFV